MIPILFIIPKYSLSTLFLLIISTIILFTILFFLLRKIVKSVKQLKNDLVGYLIFISAILILLYLFGPFPIRTYGVAVALGFLTSLLVAKKISIKEKMDSDMVFDIFVYIFVGAIIGLRIFYVLFYDFHNFIKNPLILFIFWNGGLVFYGGLIGGTIAAIYYIKKKKLDLYKILDLFTVVLPLGIFFGRFGCLAFGCCYGKCAPDGFPFKMRFPAIGHEAAGHTPAYLDHLHKGLIQVTDNFSLPVYPTQIISSLNGLLLFFILWFLFTKKKYDGQITGLFLILYSITRFSIEFLRVEPKFLHITVSQWVSIFIFAFGVFILQYTKKAALNKN